MPRGDAAHPVEEARAQRAVSEEMPADLRRIVAAVLLLDDRAGEVVYVNEHASSLAPQVTLPCSFADWSAAAELRTAEGQRLGADEGPLARMTGEGHHGEAVFIDVAGHQRQLYMAAFPLHSSEQLRDRTLVVLLDFGEERTTSTRLDALKNRAMGASRISFTISDPTMPDNPLIWVNDSFTAVTGYAFEESVGRNCRFLQGPDTDGEAVEKIRQALREEQVATVSMLNYRRDGSRFWNELTVSPVLNSDGRMTHFVGVQRDVTARVELENERERAYQAERQARNEAQQAHARAERLRLVAEEARHLSEENAHRLLLLLQSTTALSREFDLDEGLAEVARVLVPRFADWCAVDLLDDQDRARRITISGGVAATGPVTQVVRGAPPLVDEVLRGGHARLLQAADEQLLVHEPHAASSPGGPAHVAGCSAIVVPLTARRHSLGALTLVRLASRSFEEDDLRFAEDLARRLSFAVDNARLYERQRRAAEQLQRSLLPELPEVPRLELAARYLVSSADSEVGGDWYDVIALPDGATGLAIGDVMGHDLAAAAVMGQLRSSLRSYAFQQPWPGRVLSSVDELMHGLGVQQLATVCYARLEPRSSGFRLRYASAGHLPIALLTPEGSVRLLRDGHSVLLGADHGESRPDAALPVSAGSTLLLFTDGLVERRGRDIDEGLELLAQVLADAGPDGKPGELCDRVLARLARGPLDDDAALLAVRLVEQPPD